MQFTAVPGDKSLVLIDRQRILAAVVTNTPLARQGHRCEEEGRDYVQLGLRQKEHGESSERDVRFSWYYIG